MIKEIEGITKIDGQQESLNPLGVDTFLFDYGGVVGTHRVEPYWGQLSALLNSDPKKTSSFLNEATPHGIAFRKGELTVDGFWDEVERLAGVSHVDHQALMDNWARSYAVDPRMIALSDTLRRKGYKTGILMNADRERFLYIQETYHLEEHFDHVISSYTHGITKPEPRAYEVAKEVVGRVENPSTILNIDDRSTFVDVAKSHGMQGYTFTDYESFVQWLEEVGILQTDSEGKIF